MTRTKIEDRLSVVLGLLKHTLTDLGDYRFGNSLSPTFVLTKNSSTTLDHIRDNFFNRDFHDTLNEITAFVTRVTRHEFYRILRGSRRCNLLRIDEYMACLSRVRVLGDFAREAGALFRQLEEFTYRGKEER